MVRLPQQFLNYYQQEQLRNLPSYRGVRSIEPRQYWQNNNYTLSSYVWLFEITLYGLVNVSAKNLHLSKFQIVLIDIHTHTYAWYLSYAPCWDTIPIDSTTAPEYFSLLPISSRFIIIFITNMENNPKTANTYHVCRVKGFKKISNLILFVEVDSSMKQGLTRDIILLLGIIERFSGCRH